MAMGKKKINKKEGKRVYHPVADACLAPAGFWPKEEYNMCLD